MTLKKFAAALLATSMIAAGATVAYGMGGSGGGGSGAGAGGAAGGAGGPHGGPPSVSDGAAVSTQQATPVARTHHRTQSQ